MKPTLTLPLVAGLWAVALTAQAQPVTNGDFSAGLSGWEVLGDASVQPAAPTGQQLWLTTASTAFEDDSPLAAGVLNRSGVAAAEVGVPGGVESFAGLTLGALDVDAVGLMAFEGSAARQTFSAAAGDTLSFRWDFGTNDALADYAFVVLDGQFSRLAGSVDATLPGGFGDVSKTGDATFNVTFASGGAHTLVFGVVDVGDFNLTSTLAIGNVQVTAVPEAPALPLLLGGLVVAGLTARRQNRA